MTEPDKTIPDLILEFYNMTHMIITIQVMKPPLFLLPLRLTLILLHGMLLIFISMNIPYGNHLDSGLSNFWIKTEMEESMLENKTML